MFMTLVNRVRQTLFMTGAETAAMGQSLDSPPNVRKSWGFIAKEHNGVGRREWGGWETAAGVGSFLLKAVGSDQTSPGGCRGGRGGIGSVIRGYQIWGGRFRAKGI